MRLPFTPCVLGLTLLASAAQAQTADNPVTGKTLFENTGVASSHPNLPTCVSCHGSVEDRRIKISVNTGGAADPYADIDFATAMTHFTTAIANQGGMKQFQVLTAQQQRDIAAYLADTPKTTPPSETPLSFSAALNGNSAAQTVTLRHATTAAVNLSVKGVTLEGSGAAQFLLGNPAVSCLAAPSLAPAQSCAVNVTYVPTSSGAASAELVFRMSQGTSGDFYRVLPLAGSVAATTAPADDSGGGALGLAWLLALGAAVAGLSRRRD